MSIKINKYYQYVALIIGILCVGSGFLQGNGLTLMVGTLVTLGAGGTIIHLHTGHHNTASKLPKDFNTK